MPRTKTLLGGELENPPPKHKVYNGKRYLHDGNYRMQSNADRRVSDLRSQGYDARVMQYTTRYWSLGAWHHWHAFIVYKKKVH